MNLTNANWTNFDLYAQQAALWEWVFDLLLRLDAQLRAGKFASDAHARREAESLLTEASDFYQSLLTA